MIKYKVKDAAADLGVSNKENNDNTRGKRTRCDF